MSFEDVAAFHGHACPGLAMGYRMALAGLSALSAYRAQDEELVAVTENDACGVDALQCLTGCTFGKGNLIFRDFGKSVYTLYCRSSGRGVRVVFHGRDCPDSLREDRAARMRWILTSPEESMLTVTPVRITEPPPARIHGTVICPVCGEGVMETRLRNGRCIPCFQAEGSGG